MTLNPSGGGGVVVLGPLGQAGMRRRHPRRAGMNGAGAGCTPESVPRNVFA